MSKFCESLKRLYLAGSVTVEKLDQLKTDGKISEDEYSYIVSEQPADDSSDLQTFYDAVTQEVGL